MVTDEELYRPKPGDLVILRGFTQRYRVVDVGPCPHRPDCPIPAVLIHLRDPPHPLRAWLGKLLRRPVCTTRLTWVHAEGARLSYENVKEDPVEHDHV